VVGAQGEVEHVPLADSSFGVHDDYTIYLPPGYGQDPRRRYPVVYLLHGGSDTVSFFVELGIREDMDDVLGTGAVGPMLLVLVDGAEVRRRREHDEELRRLPRHGADP
jgi:enterochelin esterase-like enzyme